AEATSGDRGGGLCADHSRNRHGTQERAWQSAGFDRRRARQDHQRARHAVHRVLTVSRKHPGDGEAPPAHARAGRWLEENRDAIAATASESTALSGRSRETRQAYLTTPDTQQGRWRG